MNVLDASALLAFLAGEPGADRLPAASADKPWILSAANWSEVCQKLLTRGVSWPDIRALPPLLMLSILPIDKDQAELSADLLATNPQLSLGDRLCLSLGNSLHAKIWTADRAWAGHPRVHLIR